MLPSSWIPTRTSWHCGLQCLSKPRSHCLNRQDLAKERTVLLRHESCTSRKREGGQAARGGGRGEVRRVEGAERSRRTPLRPRGKWSYDRVPAPTRRLGGDQVAKRPSAGRLTRFRQWPCARLTTPRGTGRRPVCRTLTRQASRCLHVLRVPKEGTVTAGIKRGFPEDGEAFPVQCTPAKLAATRRRRPRLVGKGAAWPRDGSSDGSPAWWRAGPPISIWPVGIFTGVSGRAPVLKAKISCVRRYLHREGSATSTRTLPLSTCFVGTIF